MNFDDLSKEFRQLETSFTASLNNLNEANLTVDENIVMKINFLKEDIEIRVECLKGDLDKIKDKVHEKLDKIASELLREKAESMMPKSGGDDLNFDFDLQALRKDIEDEQSLSLYKMMHYENRLRLMNKKISKLNSIKSENILHINETELDTESVCTFLYELDLGEISSIFKQNQFNQSKITERVHRLCVLPNGNLLTINQKSLTIFDKKLNVIAMSGIHFGEVVNAVTNGVDMIFILNRREMRIKVSDLDLNEKQISVRNTDNRFCIPHDLFYYRGSLYVCESMCIKKLREEQLTIEDSYQFNFQPLNIQIIESVAFVLGEFKVDKETKTACYVFDSNNFMQLHKIDSEASCSIGSFGTYFYQNNALRRKIYFYNTNGELVDIIDTSKFYGSDPLVSYSIQLTYFNNYLIMGTSSNVLENSLITFGKRI